MTVAIDTNVLVRLLVRDDESQFAVAQRLVQNAQAQQQPVLIVLLVLLETEWVLRSRYRHSKEVILQALTNLLESEDVRIDDEAVLEEALHLWKAHSTEFADCLITAKTARLGCEHLATFDAAASRLPGAVRLA